MTTMTFTGNLVRDPNIKRQPDGKAWAGFTILWSEREKNQVGQWADTPAMAVNVSCYGSLAENAATTLGKGMRVTVTGRAKPSVWNSQRGEQMQISLTADSVAVDLRFATAQVTKSTSNQGQGNNWNQQPNQQQADPFGSQQETPFGASNANDEPPFN
ncbi:single-stranded DNA-binding protein [Corynebacterium sp. HMSC28B08]|uniref:single-stranded DNA-binding protein n=1 Tax=Corynebacterium sp. HMSC28B08 TaxID=1581066 RepID=UPI0008A15496|nr:single-stranded DNA-binding protein [Corynebacterium sp. HMSC28B08]OFT88994.1 hypothetical protein HMPREF3098_06775 [Corynebacterium sp. HMSC28B08]